MYFWHKLSPGNKTLFTIAFFLYFQNKVLNIDISLKIGTLIPDLLNNSLPSCSLISCHFLQLHTAHFDKSSILPVLVLLLLDFYFLYFFYTSNNKINVA